MQPRRHLLAWIAPIALFAVGLLGVIAVDPGRTKTEQQELRNAGRSLNGRSTRTGLPTAIDARLDACSPRIVVLGNSIANANFRPALVAQALKLRPCEVQVLSVPHSISSHWYAILDHRVFGRGHNPALVMVVSSLDSLLLTQPYSEASTYTLDTLTEADEPVLSSFVTAIPGPVRAWRNQRMLWRDRWIRDLRDGPALALTGRRPSRPLARVLSETRSDPRRLPAAALAAVDPALFGRMRLALANPEESLLPAFLDLIESHGSTLMVVTSPLASSPAAASEPARVRLRRDLTELLKTRRHIVKDMRYLQLPNDRYINENHMNAAGAAEFTELLIPDIERLYRWTLRGR